MLQPRITSAGLSAERFERTAIEILRAKFVGFEESVKINQVAFDGSFSGSFRGHTKRWYVEILPGKRAISRQRLNNVISRYRHAVGSDDNHTALLLITGAGLSIDAETTLTRRQIIELVILDDLERELLFEIEDYDYPGKVANVGHNSREYHDAIAAVDAVANELRSSNSLELHADIRDRLLVEVKAGRTLLEATHVRIIAIKNTIWPALAFLAKVGGTAIIGELAKDAAKKLAALLLN
jgi:hypothetical protein